MRNLQYDGGSPRPVVWDVLRARAHCRGDKVSYCRSRCEEAHEESTLPRWRAFHTVDDSHVLDVAEAEGANAFADNVASDTASGTCHAGGTDGSQDAADLEGTSRAEKVAAHTAKASADGQKDEVNGRAERLLGRGEGAGGRCVPRRRHAMPKGPVEGFHDKDSPSVANVKVEDEAADANDNVEENQQAGSAAHGRTRVDAMVKMGTGNFHVLCRKPL